MAPTEPCSPARRGGRTAAPGGRRGARTSLSERLLPPGALLTTNEPAGTRGLDSRAPIVASRVVCPAHTEAPTASAEARATIGRTLPPRRRSRRPIPTGRVRVTKGRHRNGKNRARATAIHGAVRWARLTAAPDSPENKTKAWTRKPATARHAAARTTPEDILDELARTGS